MKLFTKRLVLLNQSTGSLFLELACGLAPCYLEGAVLVSNGSLNKYNEKHVDHSLRIHRAPRYDRRSRLHRIFSWITYTLYITRHVLFARRGDVILLVSNPPLLAPWVWLLSHLRSVPYVILVYDIHPDVLIQAGVLKSDGLTAHFWRAMNRLAYGRAQALITIGSRMAAVIEQEVGQNGPEVRVIPPWVDVQSMRPIPRIENPVAADYVPPDKTVVLYSGNMGASHDIDSILEAARLLRNDADLFFLLIGGGERFGRALEFAKTHALENLKVLPWQPADKVRFTMPLGDIALVALDEGMEDLMVPSKSFAYMAAGSALVAITNEPSELSDLLSCGNFGIRVAPRNPQVLAEAIRGLTKDKKKLKSMQLDARRIAEKYYSREVGIRSFKDALTEAGLVPVNP